MGDLLLFVSDASICMTKGGSDLIGFSTEESPVGTDIPHMHTAYIDTQSGTDFI